MAEDAVSSEPVSRLFTCLTGKLLGNALHMLRIEGANWSLHKQIPLLSPTELKI